MFDSTWLRRTTRKSTIAARRNTLSRRRSLRLEPLERRTLLAAFPVTTTADSGDGSLRWAIEQANLAPGGDEIHFAILSDQDTDGDGVYTIQPLSALPAVTDTVEIDGWTQADFAETPVIEIDGSLAGSGVNGLTIQSQDNMVRGLTINRFSGSGIVADGQSGNIIQGNFVGTDSTGMLDYGNGIQGVSVAYGASGNLIGTDGDGVDDEAERNLISGNGNNGVCIWGAGSDNNVIAGNYIGTDVTGTAAIANGHSGVAIGAGPANNRVGTDGSDDTFNAGEANLISGNNRNGIYLKRTTNTVVAGNLIGLDATGVGLLGNGQQGVQLFYYNTTTTVGTDGDGLYDELEHNVISGNANGILLSGSGVENNVIAGNFIGTDVTGTIALGNQWDGIQVKSAAARNLIGTNGDGVSDSLERNVLSGNSGSGIYITDADATENHVAGNFIGTDFTGTIGLGNGGNGVTIGNGTTANVIGVNGDGLGDEVEGNVISGNAISGVFINGVGTEANIVAGNFIGTDVSGTLSVGNAQQGIRIEASAARNWIGTNGDGTGDTAEGNLIAGNGNAGITLGSWAIGNVIAGNLIGTDVTGEIALPNQGSGVYIWGRSSGNRVGTDGDGSSDSLEMNVISGNLSHGLTIYGPDSHDNTVAGNLIGVDVHGTAALGNGKAGICLTSAYNIIGTNGDGDGDEVEGNVVSGNARGGIEVLGEQSSFSRIAGNLIGTSLDGTTALGNGSHGVWIYDVANNNIVGTNGDGVSDDLERNVISGNGSDGVRIVDSGTDANTLAGNYIGTSASGQAGLPNQGAGVAIYSSANNLIGTNGDGISDDLERNIISGNVENGVCLSGTGASGNVIAGNFIGTDASGMVALANAQSGVAILEEANRNRVGTDGSNDLHNEAERNVISGNSGAGVYVKQCRETKVAGNYIGMDASGTEAIPNGSHGVSLVSGSQYTLVGTDGDDVADTLERNVISGNGLTGGGGFGVAIIGDGTDYNTVAGNFIGTDATGNTAAGNKRDGVYIASDACFNVIGTDGDGQADDAEGNVVSGNTYSGIWLRYDAANNIIAGNLIGTTADGTSALPNSVGITCAGGAYENRIGSDGDGQSDLYEPNVISGNSHTGIVISGDGTNANIVAGNWIGTDPTGIVEIGNGHYGIAIVSAAQKTRIGGVGILANTIAYNGRSGVGLAADAGQGNAVRGNSIHSNSSLGLDLSNDGVTANDVHDADSGPNLLQNFPSLTGATPGVSTRVLGSITGVPDTTLEIDFFANSDVDPSGHGEGERYLGTISVTTDSNSDAVFDALLAAPTVAGEYLTATATDPDGNTSEFSAATVINTVPEIDLASAVTWDEGSLLSLAGSFVDPDFGPWTATVDYGDGGGPVPLDIAGDNTFVLRHTYEDNGQYAISVTVADQMGAFDAAELLVDVTNIAPTGAIAGPSSWLRLLPFPLVLSATDPSPVDQADDFVYSVDWGDGTPLEVLNGSSTRAATHRFAEAGQYSVEVSVEDKDGGVSEVVRHAVSVSAIFSWGSDLLIGGTLGNDIIDVTPGSVYVTLNGQEFGPFPEPSGQILVYGFDGDDQLTIDSGVTADAQLVGDEGKDILVAGSGSTVLDGGEGDDTLYGGAATNTIIGGAGSNVFVDGGGENLFETTPGSNVPEVFADTYDVLEDGLLVVSSSVGVLVNDLDPLSGQLSAFLADDPDYGTLTLEGDGSFTYAPEPDYYGVDTFSYWASNAEASSSVTTVTIQVNSVNDLPTVLPAQGASISESETFVTAGRFSDVDSTGWTATVDYGDGSGIQPLVLGQNMTFTLNHQYVDDGQYTVTVSISDGEDVGYGTLQVAVSNMAPTLQNVAVDSWLSEDGRVTLSGQWSDPGTMDTFEIAVQWGDGTTETFTYDAGSTDFALPHQYEGGGIFEIEVTVQDDDLGADSASTEVAVTGARVHEGTLQVVGSQTSDHAVIGQLPFSGRWMVVADFLPGCFHTQIFDTEEVKRIDVLMGDGDDTVVLTGNVSTPAIIDGGMGNDKLLGGRGDDVLIGGKGNDLLVGHFGRDLLVGGSGQDRIVGNFDDDILISGTTAFDRDRAALDAIMAEWTSDRDSAARIANLRGEGTEERLNGDYFLIAQNSDVLDPNATVFDDNARDILSGGAGQDWFFANFYHDDDDRRDRITDLKAWECADDLDFVEQEVVLQEPE